MNCTDFEAQIDEFIGNSLSDTTHYAMIQHKAQCASCDYSLKQHMSYLALLSSWQEPKLNEQKKASLLARLGQQPTSAASPSAHPKRYGFASGFAAASFLAIAFFVSGQFMTSPEQADIASLFEQDDQLSQEITLVINVTSDMPDAELQLALPAELSVIGHEYLSQVKMPVSLKKGKNTIVIPVQLEEFAFYADNVIVDASLIYKNSKKDFALDLDQYLDLDSPQNTSDELIYTQPITNSIKTV